MSRGSFAQYYQPQNGGRSPYAAYAQSTANDRHMSDLYDYVDEDHNVVASPHAVHQPVFDDDDSPDIIHVRFQGKNWVLEFPPFSIAEEKVLVRHVRARVASKVGLEGQEGKIKLVYKEHELRRNDQPLRKYGCKQNSEISAIVLSEPKNYDRRDRSDSDSEYASSRRSADEGRRTNRSNSTYRTKDDPRQRYPPANGHLHPHHNTPPISNTPTRQQSPMRPSRHEDQPMRQPSPTASAPQHRPSAPAVQPPQADPSTPIGKVQKMRYDWERNVLPLIQKFIRSPPQDKEDRDKEYLRLSEIAYVKVFEAGDNIDLPDGPEKEEIKKARKQLFDDAHMVLRELDAYKPKK